jgi:hypothetical protein
MVCRRVSQFSLGFETWDPAADRGDLGRREPAHQLA